MSELFNPHLAPWSGPKPSSSPGKGTIETYGPELRNLPYQHRGAAPTAYENALANAMETAFGEGIVDLGPLVARVNALDVRAPDGAAWTVASFRAELARLGY